MPDSSNPLVVIPLNDLREIIRAEVLASTKNLARELRDEWLTTTQVVNQYGVSRSTVNGDVAAGLLVPEHRATSGGRGKTHRFRRSTIENWLTSRSR